MANPIIRQILAEAPVTEINGVQARLTFTKATLAALFQGLCETRGKGVSENFVTEQEANDNAQIMVNKVVPVRMKPRMLGGQKNGGSFSKIQHFPQTTTVGIDILVVLDDPIIIPRVSQDRIGVDLLAEHIENFGNYCAVVVNGMTAAEKLLATWNADADDRNEVIIGVADSPLDKHVEANSMLDLGDSKRDYDVFPTNTRIAVYKMSYRGTLKAKGVLTLGGANDAYAILRAAGLNPEGEARPLDDGYWGTIDGVEVHGISNESLLQADGFLGLPDGELAKSNFIGYVSSSYANARGFSMIEATKVIDAHGGQGLEFQPLAKMGCAVWSPKGNVIISKGTAAYDPIKDLKTLFTGVTGITFKTKPSGSRYYADCAFSAVGASAFTATFTAKDDANVDHAKAAVYYVGAAPVKSLADFVAGHTAATYKGSATSGSAVSTTIADTQYVNVLIIADDGTVTIASTQYNA